VGAPAPNLKAEKIILGVIFRKNIYMHPQYTKCTPRQSKSQFLGHFCWAGEIWRWVGVVHLLVLDAVV